MALRQAIIVLLLVILLPLAGCVQEATKPAVLEFSTSDCTRALDPYSPPEAGILETTWENESTFRVDGFVKTFCGGAEISGDHATQGNTITLFYNITITGPITRCLCAHGVHYRITGLPRGEYRVVMEKR